MASQWEDLLGDLALQWESELDAAREAEAQVRSRHAVGQLSLAQRCRAAVGRTVVVSVTGGTTVRGRLTRVGVDWLLLADDRGRESVLPFDALIGLDGLPRRGAVAAEPSDVERRLDFRWVLRGLLRDRSPVLVTLKDGARQLATLEAVGLDHVDLAAHATDEDARNRGAGRSLTVPLGGIVLVSRG